MNLFNRNRILSCAFLSLCATAGATPGAPGIPAHFEKNLGQLPEEVKYRARLGEHAVWLTANQAVAPVAPGRQVRLTFRGGNAAPVIEPLEPRAAKTNYISGRRSEWRTGIPHFARVRYKEVYPGVDVDYYLSGDRLEFDFIVRPGADPSGIAVRYSGADRLLVNDAGDLVIEAAGRQLRQLRPVVYQEIDAEGRTQRRAVEGRYQIAKNEVRFILGGYDRNRTLVIDPVLVYSSFLGGVSPEIGSVIAVDSSGKVWVAGNTGSDDLPVRGNPYKDAKNSGQDVFVARFNPGLSGADSLEMLTYLGGSGADEVKSLDIAPSGFVVLAGSTTSTDFPMVGNSTRPTHAGDRDVFVALLNPFESGEFLVAYTTYLGGQAADVANAVTMDASENIYVTGYTTSEDFPLTDGRYQGNKRGGYEVFVSRLNPGLAPEAGLTYSTYYGSESTDVATAIAVDSAGMIYFAGYSLSQDIPVSENALAAFPPGRGDAFIAKLDPSRGFPDALLYGSYLGGSDFEKALAMKLDHAGGVILAGYTDSDDFPVTANAFQPEKSGDSDLFVVRLDLSREPSQAITYSTFLGGAGTDILYGAAVDASNRVAITGYTLSEDFPRKGDSFQSQFNGAIDAFVAWIDPAASGNASLIASTYLGGGDIDAAYGVAVDAAGRAYVTGFSVSPNLPVTGGAWNPTIGGISDAFLVAIDF